MLRRKFFDIAVVVAVTASAAASFFIIRDFSAESEARSASAALENTSSLITSDLSARFLAAVSARRDDPDGLFDSTASIDMKTMRVTPISLAGRVFSRTDIRPEKFGAATLERLKNAMKSPEPSVREAALSYYLDPSPDSFAHEKAVLYIHLMELKKAAGRTFDREYESVRSLLPAIVRRDDRKFLADRIRGLTAGVPEEQKSVFSDMFSERPAGAPVSEDAEGAGALAAALARDAVIRPKDITIAPTTVGGRSRLMISGSAGPDLFGAAFINVEKAGAYLSSRYGAALEETMAPGRFGTPFRGAFYLSVPESSLAEGFSAGRAAPYIPVLVIIGAFLYIRFREREATKMSLAMTEFASKISHQLKMPLSSALLYLELAERHFREGDKEKAAEMIAAAGSQARALSFLFENFSALNRIFSDGVRLFPELCDLKEELFKFFKAYSYDVEKGKVEISVDIPDDLLVSVDRWAFYNILNNIVSNSIKYSGKKPVKVTISAVERDGTVKISLADDGRGIPADESERIFEKFYKGSNASSDQRSSGLGLFIARSLAEKMGGSLSYDGGRGPDSGAKFDLVIGK